VEIDDVLTLGERGAGAVGVSSPVVRRGTARIRSPMSAVHTLTDLDPAAERVAEARAPLER
jgi:7-keto-8-aminopelargonate synthetase-like enzyme